MWLKPASVCLPYPFAKANGNGLATSNKYILIETNSSATNAANPLPSALADGTRAMDVFGFSHIICLGEKLSL